MPYVIVPSGIGETAGGTPDRRRDVPVRVRLVSERVLCVDDERRAIIWSEGENGVVTVLVDGGTQGVRNRERRVVLARALGLLQQLTSCLKPLAAESAEPERN